MRLQQKSGDQYTLYCVIFIIEWTLKNFYFFLGCFDWFSAFLNDVMSKMFTDIVILKLFEILYGWICLCVFRRWTKFFSSEFRMVHQWLFLYPSIHIWSTFSDSAPDCLSLATSSLPSSSIIWFANISFNISFRLEFFLTFYFLSLYYLFKLKNIFSVIWISKIWKLTIWEWFHDKLNNFINIRTPFCLHILQKNNLNL